jgi:anthranilate phosphoribosyltransferase
MLEVVKKIQSGQSLTMDEMATVVDTIMQGQVGESEIADFLLALR